MKSTCEILFILSGGWNSATCTWNKLFPKGALKNGDLKNFSKLQVNTRSSHPEVFCKKTFLKILQNSQKNVWSPFLIKLQAWGSATLLKKTPVLSCEIYKLFISNYFEEHLWTSASKNYLKRDSNTGAFLWILWIIQEHLFSRGSTNG